MAERKFSTAKKNGNRPKAADRGLYSGMQRNYGKPKPEEKTKNLFK